MNRPAILTAYGSTYCRRRRGQPRNVLSDIVQAHNQTNQDPKRIVYLSPAQELWFPSEVLLHVERYLYGLTVARLLWFKTYQKHNSEKRNI